MAYTPENNPYMPGDPYAYDLKWIVSELKKALELYQPLHDEFTDLSGDFTELHDYVMNYFATLDLSQEVSDKLDQMAADGSLDAIIQPLFEAYKAEINGDIATQNEAIRVLQARMDAFASLPDGSTAGDAELIDIRIGVNGVTYSSAGDAVRAQIGQISENTRNIFYFTNAFSRTLSNGISVSFDNNGSTIILNGSSTASGRIAVLGNPSATTADFRANLTSGTYTFNRIVSGAGVGATLRYRTQSMFEESATAFETLLGGSTITIEEPTEVWFGIIANRTFDNQRIEMIIEAGEETGAFIPHGLTAVDAEARIDIANIKNEIADIPNIKTDIAVINSMEESDSTNLASLPSCYYPMTFTNKQKMSYGTYANSTQGMCGDKKRYLWVSYKSSNDTSPTTILKYDIINNEIISSNDSHSYGHANDMTYVEDTNEIYIISWVTNDETLFADGGTLDRISVIDADTLELKREFGLASIIGDNVDYPALSAITYNPIFKMFAGIIRPHRIDDVSVKGIVTWRFGGDFIASRTLTGYPTTSGMDSDNNYIYGLFGYRIFYHDWWTLHQVGKTTDQVLADKNTEIGAIQEAESLCICKNKIYVNANNFAAKSDNPIPRLTIYESTPETMEYLPIAELINKLSD